jgi:hypothetical protein
MPRLPLVYTKNVNVGDYIIKVSGKGRILAVGVIPGQEEYVVVIASPFATNHMMANLYYNMHRFEHSSPQTLLNASLLRSVNETSLLSVLVRQS